MLNTSPLEVRRPWNFAPYQEAIPSPCSLPRYQTRGRSYPRPRIDRDCRFSFLATPSPPDPALGPTCRVDRVRVGARSGPVPVGISVATPTQPDSSAPINVVTIRLMMVQARGAGLLGSGLAGTLAKTETDNAIDRGPVARPRQCAVFFT